MAKKPGPVAGKLGDTEYYYKSDGTVVDENGVQASARISAMFAAPPVVEEVAKKKTRKKLKKNNAQLAGIFKNSKYYYAPDGSVIDDRGLPAPAAFAKAFAKAREERTDAIKEALAPVAPTETGSAARVGAPSKDLQKQIAIANKLTDKLVESHKILNELQPKIYESLNRSITKLTEQNELVIRQLMDQNVEFQEKVIEQITGQKGPTRSGGSVARPGKGKQARRPIRKFKTPEARAKYVKDRAQRIADIRQKENEDTLKKLALPVGLGFSAALIAATGAGDKRSSTLTGPERPTGPMNNIRTGGSTGAPVSGELGSVSAKYESGGRGVDTVSSGRGDPGGVSYGAHQLASKTGTMAAYLKSQEGQKYAGEFAGLTPGSPEFNAAYRKVAQQDSAGFAESQKAFITRTHYQPVAEHAQKLGYDTSDRRVQEALYSMSVQHGGAKKIISAAGSGQGKSAEEQVKSLYAQRSQYVTNLGMGNLVSRYRNEERDVLGMSGTATATTPAAPQGTPTPGQATSETTPGGSFGAPTREGENGRLSAGQLAPVGVGSHRAQPAAASAMIAMRAAAKADGVDLGINDSYRSYEGQVAAKARWAAKGQPHMAATPGRSNHGWGLAFDMGFGSNMNSPGFKWMQANAAKFGFKGPLQRPFEPWHWEYNGGGTPGAKTEPVPGVSAQGAPAAPGYIAGQQNQAMTRMAESNALANQSQSPPGPIIFNNTIMRNHTQSVVQSGSLSQISRPGQAFNPLAVAMGAVIGGALRGLF